jgi:hypothetical protein
MKDVVKETFIFVGIHLVTLALLRTLRQHVAWLCLEWDRPDTGTLEKLAHDPSKSFENLKAIS